MSHLRMHKWILGHKFTRKCQVLKTMLLDSILSADVSSPGSGIYVPWYLYNKKENQIVSRYSSEKYLQMVLSKTFDEDVKDIFKSVHKVVGPLTKLIVKPSEEHQPVIKYRNSFQFPLVLDKQFHAMIGYVESIEQFNPIVIMIEGAPETVGEINSLLEWNHNSKRPVVLIARSFPEEVSATLATNWVKGSLTVLPFRYGDSLETINLAADMCSITKGELISNQFGDVISVGVVDEDKWGEVESVLWNSKGLFLQKDVDVSRHINALLVKIKDTENEDLFKIYQDRILSLSNDAVEIWIPKENLRMLEELDLLIKHYNGFVVSGAVETPIGMLPNCFVEAASSTGQSLKESIHNIGGFLLRVDNEVVA